MKKKKPAKKYGHLTNEERSEIAILLNKKYSLNDIGQALGRDKSTISREIKRNRRKIRSKGGTKNGPYEARVAKHKSYLQKKMPNTKAKK